MLEGDRLTFKIFMRPELQAELQNFLNQYAEKKLSRISPQEVDAAKSTIANFVAEIEALPSLEEKKNLLNLRFGSLKNSVLHIAAKFGDDVSMTKILALAENDKAYVDAVNDDFFTPLHFAASNGHLSVTQILLAAGAKQSPHDAVQNRQWVPIHYAAQQGHQQVVETLIQAGVDREVKTYFGLTPLVIAVEFGRTSVAKFLLSIGVSKNVQTIDDNQRMTALHYAVIGGHKEIVSALLNSGINREKETILGLNVLEFAAKHNDVDIVSMLLAWGVGKWDSALKIAREYKNVDAVNRIEKYRQMKKNLFNATWLKFFSSDLIAMIKQFNKDNRHEMKIILSPEVLFNAYGITALQQSFGMLKKTIKSFPQFVSENKLLELNAEMKTLN